MLLVVTRPHNGPVLFCLLASVVCRRHLSSSVMLPAGGRAGRRARGRSSAAGPSAWAVGLTTLHGGPVRLRPVRATAATPCSMNFITAISYCVLGMHICDEHQLSYLKAVLLLFNDSVVVNS